MNLHDVKEMAVQNRKAYDEYGILSTDYDIARKKYIVLLKNESFIESAQGNHVTAEGNRFTFKFDNVEYLTLVNDDVYEGFEERFFPDVDDDSFIVEYKSPEKQLQAVGMSEKDFI